MVPPQSINPTLRDALLASLATLPGTRTFHIHVLISSPRKHNSLFPYARPRPRTYIQDILILLSEQSPSDAPAPNGETSQSGPELGPRILVTAVEACLYTIPSTSSAIFYVSKVDSTGQGQHPSPTSTVVRTLLKYYANPKTRPIPNIENFWIHLFARAQNQYLFPNSSEHPKKKVLSDIKLCAWWKRVLTDVAEDILKEQQQQPSVGAGAGKGKEKAQGNSPDIAPPIKALKLHYILPGYSEDDAIISLKYALPSSSKTTATPKVAWEYGHPYSQTEIPLPCPREPPITTGGGPQSNQKKNLGHVIPWFDDDPKARFIDEIAYIKTLDGEGIRSPARKRLRAESPAPDGQDSDVNASPEGTRSTTKKERPKKRLSAGGAEKDEPPIGELCQVGPDEFWERMSFRQECVAGAITGFFIMALSSELHPEKSDKLSDADAMAVDGPSIIASSTPAAIHLPQPGQVSSQVNKRIMTSLQTGLEFSTTERSIKSTEMLESAIRGLCQGLSPLPSTSNRSRTSLSDNQHAQHQAAPTSNTEAARETLVFSESDIRGIGPEDKAASTPPGLKEEGRREPGPVIIPTSLLPLPTRSSQSETNVKLGAPPQNGPVESARPNAEQEHKSGHMQQDQDYHQPHGKGVAATVSVRTRTVTIDGGEESNEARIGPDFVGFGSVSAGSLGQAGPRGAGVQVSCYPEEPVTSLETYRSFIYGSVSVCNPGLVVGSNNSDGTNGVSGRDKDMGMGRGAGNGAAADGGSSKNTGARPGVTVLTVRRKKKRT